METFFDDRDENVGEHSNPNLRLHGIHACA